MAAHPIRTSPKCLWVKSIWSEFQRVVHSETAQPNHCSTSWTFSFPWFSPPLPVFSPFLLLPFLNWVWNWSIFLNYLYLLNKVFNDPVLKFRLVCLSHYLPFPTPSSPKIVYLLSCVLIGVQILGTYVSFLLVALFFFLREILTECLGFWFYSILAVFKRIPTSRWQQNLMCFLSTLLALGIIKGRVLSWFFTCLVDSLGLTLTSEIWTAYINLAIVSIHVDLL